jgi:hypothetical protein
MRRGYHRAMSIHEKQATAPASREKPRIPAMTNFVETSWVRYDLLRLDRDCRVGEKCDKTF